LAQPHPGHLALAQHYFAGTSQADNVDFNVLVHLGSLIAIVAVYWRTLLDFARYVTYQGWASTKQFGFRAAWFDDSRGRSIMAIIVASIPTGLIGVFGEEWLESSYNNPKAVGAQLFITGLLLLSTWRTQARLSRPEAITPIPMWKAFVIGIVQGIAIIPGISRSGSTIAAALLMKMDRRTSGDFSFLIALPAIAGAVLLKGLEFDPAQSSLTVGTGLLSLATATITSFIFLKLLLRFVRGGQFRYFGFYCLAIGAAAMIFMR
jgi:undecaprenyl-diphosphatase